MSRRRPLRKRGQKTSSDNHDTEDDVEAASRRAQCGKHSEMIQRLRGNLTSTVDIDYGLLDELCAVDVITHRQADEVRSERTPDGRVEQLLNFVVKMSDAQQEQFLFALNRTQQTHVSEYIRAGGNLKSLNKDNWPLRCCGEAQMLNNNFVKLTETIDLKCGLLDELFAEGFLNRQQMEAIRTQQTNATQSRALLNVMYRKSFADLNKLLRCLEKTKQSYVVSLLSSSYICNDRPLSDALKSRLTKNHAMLMLLLDTRIFLLAELLASDCITQRQKIYIESEDSNGRLLDVLSRGSEADFMKFIDGLRKTGQENVVSVLLEDGVVTHTVAKTCCSEDEERLIAERFMAVLGNMPNEEMENYYAQVTRYVNELRSRGINSIAANTQHSIGLFYLCHSLDALQHLYDLFTSGELKQIVERIFTALLNKGKSVVVDTLDWDLQDYLNGMQDLYASLNLKTYSELYELAKCVRLGLTGSGVRLLRVDQLPSELLQLILNKAVSQLFVIIHRVTPRAAVYVMATVGGVSTLWWRTVTNRRYNKRVLKRFFQRVCSPFKCNPQQLQSLRIEGEVNCLTEFNGQLYVGVVGSASVHVFVSRSPFSRLADIIVQGLDNPHDIVVCRDTSQLYIADGGSKYAIWRVNLLRDKQVEKFITIDWQPWSLSVNSRRLLITPRDGHALFLYSDVCSQLNHIQLPDYMGATHAVETTHNTYIVSHVNRRTGDTESGHNSVSEVNVDGRVVRTFNSQHIDIGSVQLNRPQYLALDDNNHVIVADRLTERVVVLKSNLQLKRVLIQSLDQQPRSLCLSKSTGLLFINYYRNSPDIDIYKVLS